MNKNSLTPIIIVIIIGVILGTLILGWDNIISSTAKNDRFETKEAKSVYKGKKLSLPIRGPQGGKLFITKDFGIEVTIYENNVPPQFRLYLYKNGREISPSNAQVEITLTRLGSPAQQFKFIPEKNFLTSNQIVKEPHSYEMVITAKRNGESFYWNYNQTEGRIEMSDTDVKRHNIKINMAGPKTIKPTLTLPGEIIFNHHTLVQVVPRMPGLVTSVIRHVGQQVKKGEVLAIIESPALAELRSQYLIAQKQLSLAQKTFKREKQLWEDKITAKQDYLTAQGMLGEAETKFHLASVKLRTLGVDPKSKYSDKYLARFEILAPISGLIISKEIALGKTIKKDQEIFTIADVSTVWTAITAYPKDLNIVKVGQIAKINATAFNIESEGKVTYISTLIGEQTRTATVRVELDNKDGKWRPGMFVNAELITKEIQVPVAITANAVQNIHGETVIFGRYGKYFEIRPVELGRKDGKIVEVLEGFSAEEQYAADNSFILKAELGKDDTSHNH